MCGYGKVRRKMEDWIPECESLIIAMLKDMKWDVNIKRNVIEKPFGNGRMLHCNIWLKLNGFFLEIDRITWYVWRKKERKKDELSTCQEWQLTEGRVRPMREVGGHPFVGGHHGVHRGHMSACTDDGCPNGDIRNTPTIPTQRSARLMHTLPLRASTHTCACSVLSDCYEYILYKMFTIRSKGFHTFGYVRMPKKNKYHRRCASRYSKE